MQNLRTVCRTITFIVGFSFLFGQMYFADFDIPATLAGLCGIFVGILAGDKNFESGTNSVYVLANGVFCLIGVASDALGYYMSSPLAGNYYAWFIVAPYVAAVVFLMQQFRIRPSSIDSGDADT